MQQPIMCKSRKILYILCAVTLAFLLSVFLIAGWGNKVQTSNEASIKFPLRTVVTGVGSFKVKEIFDANNILLCRRCFFNEVLHGMATYWNIDGSLRYIGEYNQAVPVDGYFVDQLEFEHAIAKNQPYQATYYINGRVQEVGALSCASKSENRYRGGRLSYQRITIEKPSFAIESAYYAEMGSAQIMRRCYYKNGKLQGLCTMWDNEGKIVCQGEYKEGRPLYGSFIVDQKFWDLQSFDMIVTPDYYDYYENGVKLHLVPVR